MIKFILWIMVMTYCQCASSGQLLTRFELPTGIDVVYSFITVPSTSDDMPFDAKTCAGRDYCYYGVIHNKGSYWDFVTGQHVVAKVSDMKTWKDWSDLWISKFGSSGTINASYPPGTSGIKCIRFGFQPTDLNVSSIPSVFAGMDGTCMKPIIINSCVVSSDSISLVHGNLAPHEIDGHVATGNLLVTCDIPLPVIFNLTPGGDLSLKGGQITSHLTIDDNEIGTRIELPKDRSDLTIESTLKTEKRVTAGTFSGSQTLIMTVQ